MLFKKIVLLIALLTLPFSVMAKEPFQTYVIKKGDTLWGISQRFIKDPYYWPRLWSNNPFVTNPHLIYPGQKIAIYDGRIELVPVGPTTDAAPPTEPLPEPQAALTVKVPRGSQGFVGQEELDAAGTLVDTVDNRLLIAAGETVFVEMKNLAGAKVGETYSIFEVKNPVLHPVTQVKLGYRVEDLGILQITEIHEQVAGAEVTEAFREIQRGAKLRPYQPQPEEIELRKAEQSLTGTLIDAQDGKITLSHYDIVYVDLGAEDGLQVGNMFNITRPRKVTAVGQENPNLKLPDALLGAAVVVETQPHTASALVLKVAEPVYRGDTLTTMTE